MKSFVSELIRSKALYSDYIVREIRHICTNLPKRAPCSEGERQAAEYLADVLKKDCGCEEVTIESFSDHPGAFYGWLYITNSLYLLGIALFPVLPALTAILIAIGYSIDHFEFVKYRQMVDKLFPTKTGTNVTAIRHPSGECKRRILLNGHLDAAWEWRVNYRFGGVAFETMALIPTFGALYYFVLSIVAVIGKSTLTGWWLCGLIFVPFTIAIFFLCNYRVVVDGANDDLTGCYIGIALMKALRDQGVLLEHTEVGVLLTGSEEAGLRGAKAWAARHKEDFCDVPTSILSFDTIHDPKFLGVNTIDLNGTVHSDQELADLFIKAAQEQKIPISKTKVPLMGGATDSAAFTQAGFRSVGITALNHKLEKYYHTRLDSWDNLDTEGIENCLIAAAQFLSYADSGMLEK